MLIKYLYEMHGATIKMNCVY